MFDNAKQFLLSEDRGVSPVIGVILMVAITVILAAVIATFVMNMGPGEETAPNAQIEIVNESSYFDIMHDGGDEVNLDNIELQGGDAPVDMSTVTILGDNTMSGGNNFSVAGSSSGADIDATGYNTSDVDTLKVVWKNPNNDQTQVLREFEG